MSFCLCTVQQYIIIICSLKFQRYNHKSENCQSKRTFAYSGEKAHNADNCSSKYNTPEYVNCVEYQYAYMSRIDRNFRHSAYASNCNTYHVDLQEAPKQYDNYSTSVIIAIDPSHISRDS